jgi:hypothetical protein
MVEERVGLWFGVGKAQREERVIIVGGTAT